MLDQKSNETLLLRKDYELFAPERCRHRMGWPCRRGLPDLDHFLEGSDGGHQATMRHRCNGADASRQIILFFQIFWPVIICPRLPGRGCLFGVGVNGGLSWSFWIYISFGQVCRGAPARSAGCGQEARKGRSGRVGDGSDSRSEVRTRVNAFQLSIFSQMDIFGSPSHYYYTRTNICDR